MNPPRTPGQRAGLTHATVLAAARELLADQGMQALTMRGLATRLNVAPNALYSHIGSKAALVDDLLDDALAGVRAPGPSVADPAAGLQELMGSTYEVLVAHADLVPHYLARQGARGPHAHRLGDVMTTLLGRAGVTGAAADEALRALIVYTIGFAAFATQPPISGRDDRPLSAEQVRATFTTGLQWLLAGITDEPTAADIRGGRP